MSKEANLHSVPALSAFTAETDAQAFSQVIRSCERIHKAFGIFPESRLKWIRNSTDNAGERKASQRYLMRRESQRPGFVSHVVTVQRTSSGRYFSRLWTGNCAANAEREVGRVYLNCKTYWSANEGVGYYVPTSDAFIGILRQEENLAGDTEAEPIPWGRSDAANSGGRNYFEQKGSLMRHELGDDKKPF